MHIALKVRLRRFLGYYLSGPVRLLWYCKINVMNFEKKPPIIILTPGKVGSSSVYNTLKEELKGKYNVFHIHKFSRTQIFDSKEYHLNSDKKFLPEHLIIAEVLEKKMTSYKGILKIITLTREPISRKVSGFFQNIELRKQDIENLGLEIDELKAKEFLLDNLNTGVISELEQWFSEEIKGNLGIDVFARPFNSQTGYMINSNNRYNQLLLQMENLDEIFPVAIKEFLNLKQSMQLKNVNIGEQKHYSDSYKIIRNEIKLSPDTVDKIVHSKYFQHFYKDQEPNIRQKWQKH
jgi:hypothetical protein